MRTRFFTVLALAGLLVLLGPAAAGKPSDGNWWQPGDPLPTGDGGPTTLPTGVTYCGDAATYDLFAGQSTDVGSITIVNDATTLYVTFQASGTNEFGTLHLWVGTNLLDVPANPKGTPIPGHFPYHYAANGAQTHTFEVALGTSDLPAACGTKLFVVAHAEVHPDGWTDGGEAETAFGGDNPGGGPRWWYYMTYTLQCCNGNQGGGSFQTAFAYGTHVFTTGKRSNPDGLDSLELTKNRWGWAINLDATGTTTFDIWAGAGLNDTDKGTLVGTLTLSWDGTDVTVTYDLEDDYTMSEIHVYAGDSAPTTIAPGQYGYIEYFDPYVDSATAKIEDVDEGDSEGDGIWVIAHAVVFGTF